LIAQVGAIGNLVQIVFHAICKILAHALVAILLGSIMVTFGHSYSMETTIEQVKLLVDRVLVVLIVDIPSNECGASSQSPGCENQMILWDEQCIFWDNVP
jgi:hypothetical protein